MIPPNQGYSLSLDSSLNRTPRGNCYILGYKRPNENFQDVPDRAWNVISVVKISEHEGETVTCGSPYKFTMVNSPEIIHLGNQLVKPILIKPIVLQRGEERLPQ